MNQATQQRPQEQPQPTYGYQQMAGATAPPPGAPPSAGPAAPPVPPELTRFLEALFLPGDIVLVRPIETWTEGGKKRSHVVYKEISYLRAERLAADANLWAALLEVAARTRANLFFGVCPRFRRKHYNRAFQVRIVRVLWADLDHCQPAEALRRCDEAGLPRPSLVVRSGHGTHLYWLLVEPYPIDDAGDPPAILQEWVELPGGKKRPRSYVELPGGTRVYEFIADAQTGGDSRKKDPAFPDALSPKALHAQHVLQGIAAAIQGDHTQDLSRLLRLPGTLNRKDERNGKEPVPCELVECDPGRRYPFADFEKFAASSPQKAKADELARIRLPRNRLTPGRLNKLGDFINLCAVADDRSRADWRLCCWAIRQGLDKEEVWKQVCEVGKFGQRGRTYFDRTWDRAEQLVRAKIYTRLQQKAAREATAPVDALAAPSPPGPADEDADAQEHRRLEATPADVRAEAEELLRRPDLIYRIADDIEVLGVAGEKTLTATLYLVFTSRKLGRPLAARVRGPSTSGKSYVIDHVAALMPPESVIRATQMTPQALFYTPKGSLRHKLIVAGERSRNEEDDAAEATRALREMISAGRLSKMLPMKRGDTMETVLIEQEGPIAYVESTTLGEVFAEDENRAIPLYTDERSEQTRRILTALADRCAGLAHGVRAPGRVQQVHHAAQRLLARVEVVIPFAPRVGAELPECRVEARRAFPHLLSMIQASALLHQFQRERDGEGRVIACRQDYEVAARLLGGAMRGLLGGVVSEPARRFAERLRGWFSTADFSTRQAKAREETSRSSVYGWLAELRTAGLADQVGEARGNAPATWRLTDADPAAAGPDVLPAADVVFGDVEWF
jgi:hypothetical protein